MRLPDDKGERFPDSHLRMNLALYRRAVSRSRCARARARSTAGLAKRPDEVTGEATLAIVGLTGAILLADHRTVLSAGVGGGRCLEVGRIPVIGVRTGIILVHDGLLPCHYRPALVEVGRRRP